MRSGVQLVAFWLLTLNLLSPGVLGQQAISFSRDVLPILSDRCFHCHGPDAAHREADLRLDDREAAIKLRDGQAAIVPGESQKSQAIIRLTTSDLEQRMPPPAAHRKPLTPQEISILRQWIDTGAEWGKHWSFEKPVRPTVPGTAAHPIDALVRLRWQQQGLTPAPLADRTTLIRRLSFDLTGLPPTSDEVKTFLADSDSHRVQRTVDRLLDSPHYGERMAMWWLDAARYSDTDGYQQDATRNNWPWRDWVVEAFNRNMPFDQFTIEQFAGDLLPEATPEQRLATCFHRNHMTNGEGGRDPEESRIDYVIDRVNTMGTVWLGLTLGCAQCHSHKFDPLSQRDYYGLFAFFNSIDEDGKAGTAAKPYLPFTSPAASRAVSEAQAVVDHRKPILEQIRQRAETEFGDWLVAQMAQPLNSFQPWHPLRLSSLDAVEGTLLAQTDDGSIQAGGPNPFQDDYRIVASTDLSRVTGLRLEVLPHSTHTDGKLSRGKTGEFILTDVKLQVRQRGASQVRDIELVSAVADVETEAKAREYGKVQDTLDDDPRNGWTTASHDATVPHVAVFALAEPLVLGEDEELIFVMLHRSTQGDANIGRFRLSATDQAGSAVKSLEPMPLEKLAKCQASGPTAVNQELRQLLLAQFLEDHADYRSAKADYDRASRQLAEVKKSLGQQNVMVLAERSEPRATFVLERGIWDKPGEQVQRSVPREIFPRAPEELQSRLDLARWLVDRDQPLTARVIANHLWQLCFGAGLVRTPEDFGLQGEYPTHPELLDWLAVELIDSDWDIKHLLRLIVTSETYQQSSHATPEQLERDPQNRWLARGARFRLPSWMIRDAALRTSGLLNPALGGPPVMPYQPASVWAEIFMGRLQYEPSQGPAQHRRTLYAFWRRSSAPTFLFDSAQRRVCEVRPLVTNTPLQALTLLNDPTLLEASRELAKHGMSEGRDIDQSIDFFFETILSRRPAIIERGVIKRELTSALLFYKEHPQSAIELLNFGQPELRQVDQPSEVAAGTIIASMLLNLDEAITHE